MSKLSLRTFFAAAALAACLPLATPAVAASAAISATTAVPGVNLPDFTSLVDKVGPSVVNIRTTSRVSSSPDVKGLPPGMDQGDMSEFFRRFFGIPMPGAPGSSSPKGGKGGNGGSDDNGSGDNGGDPGGNSAHGNRAAPQDNSS